jgi:apolipoprotein N-acyltransferase
MRRWFLPGVGCGLLVALSVPPFGWWPLGWLGFAGIAFILPGRTWGSRFALGLGVGLGQYVVGLWWVSEFSIPGCVALMVASALFMAAALLVVPTSSRASVAACLPAAVLLSDWTRDRFPFGGFPLGGASLGQAVSPLVPVVRLGGSLLLTGELVLAGVFLAELARAGHSWHRRARAGRFRVGGGVAALLAVAVALPVAGFVSPSGRGGHLAPLRVALVQGGGPRGTRAIHTDPEIVFARHIDAASSIRRPVDLVVFPEGVEQTSYDFRSTTDSAQLAGLAAGLDATVVAGVEQDVGVRRYLNEIAAWGPNGAVVGVYVKNHLVPFGEYVPYRSLFQRFFNLNDVPYDAIAGHSPGYLRTPAAPLAVMISYEVFFDSRARGGVRAGGRLLVVPTNTASYRSTQVPTQELAADRLRAWETGRWLVQVTPTGYSGIVTPEGRVVERSVLGRRSVIQGTADLETGRTLYVALGDTPVAIIALVMLLAGWSKDARAILRGRNLP